MTKLVLPRRFGADSMYGFVDAARRATSDGVISFDFSLLEFIEPVGVVVLSNLIEYLSRLGTAVNFAYHRLPSQATNFLDDAGFFLHYVGEKNSPSARTRDTTMPLQLIAGERLTEYLYFRLMPWIARAVGRSIQSLDPLRTSLEEVFHNVRDHSGVDYGCAFAQHFPRDRTLQVAVSDFGFGIPHVVRRRAPFADDAEAMRLACQEGFTTQSNVHNRGAGLPTLTRYVTRRNGGTVLIAAGGAQVAATLAMDGTTKISARTSRGQFPGTLVRVILRTDTLVALEEDIAPEEFEW